MGGETTGNPAEGATVFLDEVSELNPACQARLLHLLPNGDAIQNAGVLKGRVISATSQDIEEEVRSGRFRKELYYRLNPHFLFEPRLGTFGTFVIIYIHAGMNVMKTLWR